MYNKKQFSKCNSKKILHKVKKQWVTISLALLMAIGGSAIAATHITANADTNSSAKPTQITSISSSHNYNNLSSPQNVMKKAANLHSSLMINKSLNSNIANNSNSKLSNSITKFNSSPHNNLRVSQNNNIQSGIYDGLNYKYYANKNLEFTSGTPDNLTYMKGDNYFLDHAQSVKFDSDIDMNNVHDLSGLLAGESNLHSVELDFDTSHVSNMNYLLNTDDNLQKVTLGRRFTTSNVANANAVFTNDFSVNTINIQSPQVKFNNNLFLHNFYRKNPDGSYVHTPHNFEGRDQGTFVDANIVDGVSPITNPNKYMSNDKPQLLSKQWLQNYHFKNQQGQNNDVESILPHYTNGHLDYWNIYYLWNPDNGNPAPFTYDNWAELTTKDFSTFQPVDQNNPVSLKNIAIPDPQYEVNGNNRAEVVASDNEPIPWEQAAGGSVISNHKPDGSQWITHDTFGNSISPDARLAYFANYNPNNTGCYLAYANPDSKGGYHQFRPYDETNIFNGNTVGIGLKDDFRDPYVTVNPKNPDQLVAYVAGGGRQQIYVLTSSDAVHWNWNRNDDVNLVGIAHGSIETPYVTTLHNQPVAFCSTQNGGIEEVAYITGYYDNNGIFRINPDSKFGSLDHGFDVYAGNFTKLDADHLAFIAWFDNWEYFIGSHAGDFTLPRILSWNGQNMESTPVEPGQPSQSDKIANDQYASNGKVAINFAKPLSDFDLKLARSNDNNNYVDFKFADGTLKMFRHGSAKDYNHNMNRTKSVDTHVSSLSSIQFYLDNCSVEAYLPDIHQMYSILDFDNTRNTPFILNGVPDGSQVTSYQFDLAQAPRLNNLDAIKNEYKAAKDDYMNDTSVLAGHMTASDVNTKDSVNDYLNTAQKAIADAENNVNQMNAYHNDSRQHAFIALANDDMNMADTKLFQINSPLNKLNHIATPYLDASAADARIANYYKTSVANSVAKANQQVAQNAAHAADQNILNQQKASVANSVNAANQQRANQAAQKADQKIAQQQRTSVANSVAAANRAKANHATQIADQDILNQQKQSVANSVNAANQRTATSAANSADKSIESSIANSYAKSADNSIVNSYRNSASASGSAANSSYAKTAAGKAAAKSGASSADKSIESSIASSYAKSADTSIANSYKNSVDNSVIAANQSKANSAAKSADTSIANSAAQSADQSIENSEAKNASQQTSSQSQQPVAPFIPMNNVISTPTAITSNSVTNNSNNDNVMNNNSSDLNGSVATSSNVNKNITHHKAKPVTKKSVNNQIPLLGLTKRTYFYQHDEAFVFTNRMKKRTNVLQATVWPNHHVVYRVRIGKRTGYMYGYLKKLVKPELFTKRNMYIHVGKRMIKLPMKRFSRIKINHAIRYAGKSYVKYYVNYGRKRGVIYGKLPKITKRVLTNKGTYSKYYQVIPKRYHYVNVKKPLLIYNNKHFTKRNHRGSIRKGITIRVKRLVRDGKMTRFELMNGRYITGLRSFVKLMK